ncbi:MAG: GNAT family N-acetyltransferase [Azonexus sp.]
MKLRPLTAADAAAIAAWPAYPVEFAELDYALRSDGWLSEFSSQPATRLFAAELAGELIAFSLLVPDGAGAAEFRLALHPAWLGCGWGGKIAAATLQAGFAEMGLRRVDLVVRRNNPRARALYRHLGFVEGGECCLTVNGQPTDFYRMQLELQKSMRPLSPIS